MLVLDSKESQGVREYEVLQGRLNKSHQERRKSVDSGVFKDDWIREQKERKERLGWEAEERRRKRSDVSDLGRKTNLFKDANEGTHSAALAPCPTLGSRGVCSPQHWSPLP